MRGVSIDIHRQNADSTMRRLALFFCFKQSQRDPFFASRVARRLSKRAPLFKGAM